MKQSKTYAYIDAIRRTQSISAAAEELGISQPAMSSYLKKTEKELGFTLFDRSQTPLKLTEEGEAYLWYETRLDALGRELDAKISDIRNLASGRLVVGGASSFNAAYLAKAVGIFSRNHPGIEVEIVDGDAQTLAQLALDNKIDLFITPLPNHDDEFTCTEFRNERIFLCLPRDFEVVSQLPSVAPREYARLDRKAMGLLTGLPCAALRPDLEIGKRMLVIEEAYGIEPSTLVTVDQTRTGFAIACAGAAMCLATDSTLQNADLDNVALFTADNPLFVRTLYIAQPRTHYASAAAREFVAVLKATSFDSVVSCAR